METDRRASFARTVWTVAVQVVLALTQGLLSIYLALVIGFDSSDTCAGPTTSSTVMHGEAALLVAAAVMVAPWVVYAAAASRYRYVVLGLSAIGPLLYLAYLGRHTGWVGGLCV